MIDCTWKTDGSPGCENYQVSEQPQADGFTKMNVTAKQGSPINIMATSTEIPDSYYLQVRIVDKGNSVSAGVVLPSEFLPGYKNKGCFYNGNLTNGSAALKTGYGPYLKNGDVVVLECAHSGGNSFSLDVYVNSKHIGRGFEIATTSNERFMPCLAVTGKVELLVQVLAEKPILSSSEVPMHPLEGKWKIENAKKDTTGNENVIPVRDAAGNELPNQRDIVLDIVPDEKEGGSPSIRVSVKVFNNIGVHMNYTSNDDKTIYDVSTTGHPMMTMMMPPPPYDQIEQQLSHAITNHWQSFRLSDVENGEAKKLTITTVQNHVMAHCTRSLNDSAPLTKYHH
ncbi:MAG: hypothetical protein SGARI_004156 [Bacillariaceae sp.]